MQTYAKSGILPLIFSTSVTKIHEVNNSQIIKCTYYRGYITADIASHVIPALIAAFKNVELTEKNQLKVVFLLG